MYADVHNALTQQLIGLEEAACLNKEVASQLQRLAKHCPKSGEEREVFCTAEFLNCFVGAYSANQDATNPDLSRPLLALDDQSENELARLYSKETRVSKLTLDGGSNRADRAEQSNVVRLETMFPQTDELKQAVFESLKKTQYDVEDYYYTSGCWQAIARNSHFKEFYMVVILVNIIYIAVETDLNDAVILSDAPLVFQIFDNTFCILFLAEVLVRFLAFKQKKVAFFDMWFLFDSFLVSLMIGETWILVALYRFSSFGDRHGMSAMHSATQGSSILRILRLVRLVRVARATRLLRSFPELSILARGVVCGLRSVIAVLCLQVLLIYVFGIIFTMSLRKSGVMHGVFDSVPQSMNCLLIAVLCGPDSDFMLSLLKVSWLYYALFVVFIILAVLTIMNMLIGILCDAVSCVADEEKEDAFHKEVDQQVTSLMDKLDSDGDGLISRDEFDNVIRDPGITAAFCDLGVDIISVGKFAEFIYSQSEELSFGQFAQMICQFRGSRYASVKDIAALREYVSTEIIGLESRLQNLLTPRDLKMSWPSRGQSREQTALDSVAGLPRVQSREQTALDSVAEFSRVQSREQTVLDSVEELPEFTQEVYRL